MNNKNKKNAVIYTALSVLAVVSVLSASLMAGCGSESSSTSETRVVNETQIVTEIVDVTDSVSSTSVSSETSSNSASSNSSSSSSAISSADNNSNNAGNNQSHNNSDNSNSSSSSANNSGASSSSSSKTSSSSQGHVSNDILNVDGNKYYVGDTFTCTVKIKTPDKIENFQGTFNYDSKYLQCTDAELISPASTSGVVNFDTAGTVHFNGSSAMKGYNYTSGGDFLKMTFKVKAEGSVKPSLQWKTVRQLTKNQTGTNYAECGLESEIIYN